MIGGVGFFSIDSNVAKGNKEKEIESLSDFAVLCRIGRQMNAIEKALKDHRIPYQKIGNEPFYKQEPVKSVIDVLKSATFPENILLREKLVNKRIITQSELLSLNGKLNGLNLPEMIEYISEKYFSKQKDNNELVFNQLKEISLNYKTNIIQFVNNISLGAGIDEWKPDIEAVNLMTLHASKGLEFNCVFIAGCENGIIPYSLFENKFSDDKEERRLLYVGMTRAKNYLFLTHAKKRFLMGKEFQFNRSPFLDKIEAELIEVQKQEYRQKEEKKDDQLKLFL